MILIELFIDMAQKSRLCYKITVTKQLQNELA